jgi:hypothetical protein
MEWQCILEAVRRFPDYEKGLLSDGEMIHLIALAQTALAQTLNGIANDIMKREERQRDPYTDFGVARPDKGE